LKKEGNADMEQERVYTSKGETNFQRGSSTELRGKIPYTLPRKREDPLGADKERSLEPKRARRTWKIEVRSEPALALVESLKKTRQIGI